MLCHYWSFVVNSLYEIDTLRATNIFGVREVLILSKQELKTGGLPKADIKSKGGKHPILQQVWQNGDF